MEVHWEKVKYLQNMCWSFDGFRLDTEDRLWTSAADGVHCFSKDGKLIGKIRILRWLQMFVWR